MNLKHLTISGVGNLLAVSTLQGSSFLIACWTASVISKADFGSLQMARVLLSYSPIFWLGVNLAIQYELPMSLGRGDQKKARALKGLLTSTCSFICLGVVSLSCTLEYARIPLNGIYLEGQWILIGGVMSIATLSSSLQLLFRSYERFGSWAIMRSVYPILFTLMAFALIPSLGMEGFLIAMVAGYAGQLAIGSLLSKDLINWYLNFKLWWKSVKYGFNILVNSFLYILMASIDLWLVGAFLGRQAAGVYGFAMLLTNGYRVLPELLLEMAQPRLAQVVGRSNGHLKSTRTLLKEYLIGSSYVFVLPAALSLSIFSFVIDFWLPQYQAAKLPFAFLLLGHFAFSMSLMAVAVITLLKRQREVTFILGCSIAAQATLGAVALLLVGSTWAAAAVTCLCLVVAAVYVLMSAARLLGGPTKDFRFAGTLIGIFVIAGSSLVCSGLAEIMLEGWAKTACSIGISLAIGLTSASLGLRHLRMFWVAGYEETQDEQRTEDSVQGLGLDLAGDLKQL